MKPAMFVVSEETKKLNARLTGENTVETKTGKSKTCAYQDLLKDLPDKTDESFYGSNLAHLFMERYLILFQSTFE